MMFTPGHENACAPVGTSIVKSKNLGETSQGDSNSQSDTNCVNRDFKKYKAQ